MTPAMAAALVVAQQHVLAAPAECSPAEVVAWGRNGCNVAGLALLPGQVDTDHAGRVQRAYSLVHASDVVVWVERWPLRANRLEAMAAVYRDLLGMPCSIPCDELGQPEPPAPLVLEDGPAANRLVTAWKARPRFEYGTVVRKPVPSVDSEAMAAACGATQTTGPEAEAPVDADASPVHSSGTSLEEPSRAEEGPLSGPGPSSEGPVAPPPLTSHAPAGEGTPSPPLPSPAGAPTRFSGESGEVLCRGCESPLIAEEVPAGACMGCEEFMESIPKATDPPPVLSVLDEAALVALGPNLVARIVRGENVLPSGSASAERVDEKRAARVEADLAASCFECESSPCVCHFTLLAPQERAGVLAAVRAQEVAREAKPKGPPRHRWSGVDPIACLRCGRVKGPQAGTCPGSREVAQ